MIQVGTTVEISREPPYPEYGVYIDDIGVVTYIASTGEYSVRINGKKNPHYDAGRKYGNNGDFWIPKNCVKEIKQESEERKMKLTGFNKVAVIEYNNTLDLHYALYDEDIKAGDHVLVTGKLSSQIKQIKNIITLDEARETYKDDIIEEVKCKVDLSAYDQRVKNRIKAAELRKEMDKKIAEMDEMNKYTVYADRNPELAKMLEEYKELV